MGVVDEEIAQGVDGVVVNTKEFESTILFVFLKIRNKLKDRKVSPDGNLPVRLVAIIA